MALDTMREWFKDKAEEIGDALEEYNATPSPSAGALRPFFGLSSVEPKVSSPEVNAFLARMEDVRDRRDAEAALRLPPVKAREDTPWEGVPASLGRSDWVTARSLPLGLSQSQLSGEQVGSLGAVPGPPMGSVPAYTLEEVAQGPTSEAIAKIAKRNVSLTSPIPINTAPLRSDTPAAVASTLPATTDKQPAGKPDKAGAPNLPAPSSEGAGGDTSERDLYLARLAAQNAAGFGGMGAGKNIDMGIADTLGERLKQVQALRAKREEQGLTDTRERANNRAQVDYLISRFPDRADDLQKLYGMTGKPNFPQMLRVEEQVALDKAKKATEEVKPLVARSGAVVKKEEAESKATKRQHDTALGWARLNAQSAAAATAAARGISSSSASLAEQKVIRSQLENIQKIVKSGSYTPLIASLEQADKAIAELNAPPSAATQILHALPGGDRFLTRQQKAYYTSVDKLRQMEQLAISGKVVSKSERAEFLRQYGTNWYANPTAAAAYINMLRAKTATQITSDLASVQASPLGQRAYEAYARQPGAITPMHPTLQNTKAISTATGPTESQIAKLRANPNQAPAFDEKFGPGAAVKILGGQ